MEKPIEMVTILSPSPGKIDRVIELLTPFNAFVESNEPYCLKFYLHRRLDKDTREEDVLYLSTFINQQGIEKHQASKPYKALLLQAAEENLLKAPPDSKMIIPCGGFENR